MNNKPIIFGEESFVIPNMAEQFYHKEMEFRDGVLVGRIACDFNLDKDKVKRQLELCNKLENIDKTDLIDMATKKKFADKDYEIKVLYKALELACKELRDDSCISCNSCNRLEMCDYVLSLYPASYFIEEAKEMLENE